MKTSPNHRFLLSLFFILALILLPGLSLAKPAGGPDRPVAATDPFEDENLDFLDEETEGDAPAIQVADPLEPWNRAMFEFNDRMYFWVMKPLAQGYRTVMPETARIGIQNFFHNLGSPIRIVNCFLQGQMESCANEMARFVYNTTFGVLGVGNPARHNPALNPRDEDMGQTLALYGIGDGFFIVWPFIGPSTLRDSAGTVTDGFLSPIYYLDDVPASIAAKGTDTINSLSFRIGDYESLKSSALEPYQAMKNFYLQYRFKRIYNHLE